MSPLVLALALIVPGASLGVKLSLAPTMNNFIELSARVQELQRENSLLSEQARVSRNTQQTKTATQTETHRASANTATYGQVNTDVFNQLERLADQQLRRGTGSAPNATAALEAQPPAQLQVQVGDLPAEGVTDIQTPDTVRVPARIAGVCFARDVVLTVSAVFMLCFFLCFVLHVRL